ncbi:TPA: helix-turn-helix domain-containing protein [Salmonella enterica subsp. enterica serovar Vietnam]|uniref:Transcriptional regulator n=1 Tax=Salmonella enterica subsp. arizonae TaxID=59203 RepID=A0A5Y2QJZ3_SALER|nr:helix-turn-helix domain-containing protein [Salmonella enterica]ECF4922150.1 transcriptional regulator [Salmonella enterica subsp. arizonae]ECI9861205.1 transcriptional regulator [Salmonella enterica subsp. arizonae]HAE8195333.1 transcriptional regulator [Salmonella enterica subsp. indica serovar 41:b:1,7]
MVGRAGASQDAPVSMRPVRPVRLTPTLANALIRHWPKGERLIAEALGIAPEHIWPSRYRKTENG